MATNNLATNIGQVVSDFTDIKAAIIEKGVPVPAGTPTKDYDDLIRDIIVFDPNIGYLVCDMITKGNKEEYGANANHISSDYDIITKVWTHGVGVYENSPNLKKFSADISNVSYAVVMFKNCKSLIEFSAERLNLSTSAEHMFYGCSSLKSFNVAEMPNATSLHGMFKDCVSLEIFKTNGITTTGFEMFENCTSLHTVDSNSRITNGARIFMNCSSLINFKMDISRLHSGLNMFSGCNNLSVESLLYILTSIPDMNSESPPELTIGAVNIAKLTPAQLQVATNKNWIVT